MQAESRRACVLVIDDDTRLCELISEYLGQHGLDIQLLHDGADAAERILQLQPDVLILDLMLPGTDGLAICRAVRSGFRGAILMLTALDDNMDEVAGLEIGADDYVTKPVSPRLLLARVRNLLRRDQDQHQQATGRIGLGALVIDQPNRLVQLDSVPISCTTGEFELLWQLATRAGQVVSREVLQRHLHGPFADQDDRRIDLAISRLRRKLGDSSEQPRYIKTIRGTGYLLARDP